MAFKLKSPFHVTPMGQTLGKGGTASRYSGPSNIMSSVAGIDYAEAEGTQNLEPPPSNETTERLAKMGEDGVPLGLNPKQKARREVKDFRKGLKADAKFDRQTEKAKKIYKRNEFEELQNLDEKGYIIPEGDEGSGTTYYNPDAAKKEKEKRSKDAFDRKWKATEDYVKASQDAAAQDKRIQDKIAGKDVENWGKTEEKDPATKMLNMEKPNRAGTPVRMLKSMEDKTPMKYKSVRKAERENLMSALAKQGEPIGTNDLGTPAGAAPGYNVERKPLKPASEIKSNPNFATPGTEFKATKPGESNQPKRVTVGDRAKESVKKAVKFSVSAALKKGEPVKKEMVNDFTMNMDDSTSLEMPFTKPVQKMRPKKANIKNSNKKGKGGKVTMDRKVSTKF